MPPPGDPARDKTPRFPGASLSHGVGLYDRFTLSSRDVQALLWEGGVTGAHAAIRPWCQKLAQDYAHRRRRRRPQPGDQWDREAVFLTMNGKRPALWRAVAQADNGLDSLVQSWRHKPAAQQCCRKLLPGCPAVPRGIMTDQGKSYGAAQRASLPGVEQRQSRDLNTRCANAQRPTRQRARRLQGCPSPGQAQRFLSAYGPIAPPFRPRRPLGSASAERQEMRPRFESGAEMTGTKQAAEGRGRPGLGDPCGC